MTKQELLRENQELKDRIIELQSEIIRLTPTKEIEILERGIIREKYVFPLPYNDDDSTGSPLPPLPENTCGRNAMEWDESKQLLI